MLHADEEFLKEELKVREKETLATFALLSEKKKELLAVVMESFNKQEAEIDIGLTEEFDELRKVIASQQEKIEALKTEIAKHGKNEEM